MKKIESVIRTWNGLIGGQTKLLGDQLSDLEISALSACIGDCYQSFHEVYFVLLEKLEKADSSDYDSIHDCIVSMYWEFDHIKKHISDAEKGFTALMALLAKKAEEKEG
jgi:hypothetical protein